MRRTTYEWTVEETDPVGGDIVDTSGYETLEQARYAASFADQAGTLCVICLRRIVGEGPDRQHLDMVESSYAYPGDTEFDNGARIPVRMLAQLSALEGVDTP